MANVSNGLTEKMKNFCREYVRNNGNGTQAYLFAYNCNSETAASIESSKLLRRDDITAYITFLNKPMENRIQNEREKKRAIIWERIAYCQANNDDSGIARYMDILNKMDSDYININRTITDQPAEIVNLDTTTLKQLVNTEDQAG